MVNLQLGSIKEKLDAIGFDRIARRSGFDTKYSKKIRAFAFLFGFMKMYSHRLHSLAHWATCLGQVSGEVVSKQAIDQKCTARHSACFKEVVRALLAEHYDRTSQEASLWADFPRVLIQDSTCWSLPASLADHFPGSHSTKGKAATARLQVGYDVKANRFHEFELQSFRDNDQKHASSITSWAREGDLLLRDLGYFSQHVFAVLAQAGVFFVSLLHYRVALYEAESGKRIELGKLMRGRTRIDCHLLLGTEAMVPVRLIGFKLSAAQAAARRRRAKKKDSRFTPEKAYLHWLGWRFFITNLPADRCNADRICRFYRLRWRIEMIFKGFKSGLHWKSMFSQRSLTYERVVITIYAMLIYVLLCWRCFRWFLNQRSCASISLLKFLTWYRLHYEQLIQAEHLDPFVAHVAKHCRYEKRNERKNYCQLIELNESF